MKRGGVSVSFVVVSISFVVVVVVFISFVSLVVVRFRHVFWG